MRIRRCGGENISSKDTKLTKVKEEVENNRFKISPWNSKEYRNYFACLESEYPIDAIESYIKILNACSRCVLKFLCLWLQGKQN